MTTMRQTVLRYLALVLIAALVLPPLTVAPARAQSVFPVIGPSGTMIYSDASLTAVNTASEVSIFQYLIPAAYVATASAVGNVATNIFTSGNQAGTAGINPTGALWNVPQPLHFRAIGLLAGGAGTILNIGVNLNDGIAPPSTGGGTATLTMNNINIVGAIAGPGTLARLDVYVVPFATGTASPNSTNNAFLTARFAYVNAAGTETVVNSSVIAGVNFASPTRFNVVGRWNAAGSSSMWTVFSRLLKIGE
jgi:hypothetical protein